MTPSINLLAVTNWIKFLGRFHPLLVHLPIGFLFLLGCMELTGRFHRFQHITAARGFILILLSCAAVLTVACGWLLASGGGYGHRVLFWHRWLGTSVGALSIILLLLWLYQNKVGIAYYSVLSVALVAMVLAAHFGGTLTFGSRYLRKYAPPVLKQFLGAVINGGLSSTYKNNSSISNNSKSHFIDQYGSKSVQIIPINDQQTGVSFYNRYIQTIFTDNCSRCHGRNRQKGHLRLDSYSWLRRGSRGHPVVIPYNPNRSRLYELISSPRWQRHHMPPRRRRQLTTDQIKLIRWWILSGASGSATLQVLHPPAYIRSIIPRLRFSKMAPKAIRSVHSPSTIALVEITK